MHAIKLILLCCVFSFALQSCKKEDLLTDQNAKLAFSDDKVLFDTVFSSIGTVTKNIRVYNLHDQPIQISSIRLGGGNLSYYRLNVNGLPGKYFENVEIRAHDSIWVFVEVTVDPNAALLPYVIQDSIVFETNGNLQDIDLVAWGQNANFIIANQTIDLKDDDGKTRGQINYVVIDSVFNSTTIWNNQLPYVIYGGYAVVDSSTTLNIQEGTQIHFSNNAGLWVYKGGTINVNGTKDNPVVFQGLRREMDYKERPGQWDRIWINDGGNNVFNYAIIKNGFIGLQTENIIGTKMSNSSLSITNCYIRNMSGLGILSRNWDISGNNNIITNCGMYNLALTLGGNYDFVNCTFANFWNNGQRGTPILYINNYTVDANGVTVPFDLTTANFKNCIVYGDNDNELELDFSSLAMKNHVFSNCILKVDHHTPVTDPLNFISIYKNSNPNFEDVTQGNYHILSNGNSINKGDATFVNFPFDIDGNNRILGTAPDLGAYEKE